MFDFTADEFESLQTFIGIIAVIFLLVALFVAWGISTLIPWEGGKDRSYIKRRWACGILWAVAWIGFFLFALFEGPSLNEDNGTEYAAFMQMCTGGIALLYPLLLFGLALLTPNSKLGSIFPLKK